MVQVHLIPFGVRHSSKYIEVKVGATELRSKDLINLEAMHRIKADYLEVRIMSSSMRVSTSVELSCINY